MRFLKVVCFLLVFLVLFVACGTTETVHLYPSGEHAHVFGNRYEVVPASCITVGQEVRYCKICHLAVTDSVEIPADQTKRLHEFTVTVVPPTEAEEGYTMLKCTLCDYVVERTDVKPPLFALKSEEGVTVTTAPSGVDALLMASTADLVLRYDVGGQTAVDATLARRLAVMLTVTEELEREGAVLTPDTVVSLTGTILGNYTVSNLLRAWLQSGDAAIASAFAEMFGESNDDFAARVDARLQRLGVLSEVEVGVFDLPVATATLRATAVMLARALAMPLAVELLSDEVPPLAQVAGRVPTVFFDYATLRVVAIGEDGGYRFLLLAGNALQTGLENELLK